MFKHKKLLLTFFIGLFIVNTLNIPIYGNAPYPDIYAESAVLIDGKTGNILYGKNENKRQYPASITKLMTALIAIENQKPTDVLTFTKEAVFGIERNSTHLWLDVDERLNLDQALHGLLLSSANDIANGIAELCDGSISEFAKHATQRAKELGAKNTNFTNPHGLHDPNHYTSAYDMALIGREIIKQPYFLEIMNTPTYQIPPTSKYPEIRYLSQSHKLLNKQRFGSTYREDVIGGKTGYTSDAGNTLVTMAKRGDMELISVVLKSNSQNLYSDTNMLLDYGFDNFKSITLHEQSDSIRSLPMYSIKSGQLIHLADCNISVSQDVSFLGGTDIKERLIETAITLPNRIDQQVSNGDVVGNISYHYAGQTLATSDLVINNVNYLPLAEPAIYPDKPAYTIPSYMIPTHVLKTYTVPIIATGVLGWVLVSFLKFQHHNKLQKKRKKILRFSKTIK